MSRKGTEEEGAAKPLAPIPELQTKGAFIWDDPDLDQ